MQRRNFIQLLSVGLLLPQITMAQLQAIKNKKILVAYYTRTLNTLIVANYIQQKIGGDLFRIETVEPYPDNYQETVKIGQTQTENKFKPKLKNHIDISPYEVIFIGSPIWNMRLTPAVASFLAKNNFQNKKIYPFFTNAGYGSGNAPKYVQELLGFNYEQDISIKTNAEKDYPNMLKINQNLIQNHQALTAIQNVDDLEKWIDKFQAA